MSDLATITPQWPAPARVRAAFTLRTGGVSAPPFGSLNLGSHVGDALDAVTENRRRVREGLRLPEEPTWLQQVHGVVVADLDALEQRSAVAPALLQPPAPVVGPVDLGLSAQKETPADAAVARLAGRVCAVQVADCMPVLFAARDGSVVGATHAGWRGLAAGVLEATVRKLGVPPSQLLVWLGPTISQAHFEVGDDVRHAFVAEDVESASAFKANARGRWQCDLYALAKRRLGVLGVSAISGGDWCTYADAARFFSYRRDGQCGRMAALIWLE